MYSQFTPKKILNGYFFIILKLKFSRTGLKVKCNNVALRSEAKVVRKSLA